MSNKEKKKSYTPALTHVRYEVFDPTQLSKLLSLQKRRCSSKLLEYFPPYCEKKKNSSLHLPKAEARTGWSDVCTHLAW